jgi:hypothetical protein
MTEEQQPHGGTEIADDELTAASGAGRARGRGRTRTADFAPVSSTPTLADRFHDDQFSADRPS